MATVCTWSVSNTLILYNIYHLFLILKSNIYNKTVFNRLLILTYTTCRKYDVGKQSFDISYKISDTGVINYNIMYVGDNTVELDGLRKGINNLVREISEMIKEVSYDFDFANSGYYQKIPKHDLCNSQVGYLYYIL